jgi:hypothetical protein
MRLLDRRDGRLGPEESAPRRRAPDSPHRRWLRRPGADERSLRTGRTVRREGNHNWVSGASRPFLPTSPSSLPPTTDWAAFGVPSGDQELRILRPDPVLLPQSVARNPRAARRAGATRQAPADCGRWCRHGSDGDRRSPPVRPRGKPPSAPARRAAHGRPAQARIIDPLVRGFTHGTWRAPADRSPGVRRCGRLGGRAGVTSRRSQPR